MIHEFKQSEKGKQRAGDPTDIPVPRGKDSDIRMELAEKKMWFGSRNDVAFWQETDLPDVVKPFRESDASAAGVLLFLVLLLVPSLEDEALQTARRLGPSAGVLKPFEFASRAARAGCPRAMQFFNLEVAARFVFWPRKGIFLDGSEKALRYGLIDVNDA
jgi:hypothetical protein